MGCNQSRGDSRGSSRQSDGGNLRSTDGKNKKPLDLDRLRSKGASTSDQKVPLSDVQKKEFATFQSKHETNSMTTYSEDQTICRTVVNREGAVMRYKLMLLGGAEISLPKDSSLSPGDIHWLHYQSIMDKQYDGRSDVLKQIVLDPLIVPSDDLKRLVTNPNSGTEDVPISQDDPLHSTIQSSVHYNDAQAMLQKYDSSKNIDGIKVKIINSNSGLVKVTLDLKEN